MNKEIERAYKLRELYDEDLFPVLDIVATVFPENLTPIIMSVASGEKTIDELGAAATIQIVRAVLKNMGKVKEELYAFLSDVSDVPAEKLRKMPVGTTPLMIWDIANDVKNADFFKVASKSF